MYYDTGKNINIKNNKHYELLTHSSKCISIKLIAYIYNLQKQTSKHDSKHR